MQDGQIDGEQGHIGRLKRAMCSLDDETFVSSCVCVHLETLAWVFRVSVNESHVSGLFPRVMDQDFCICFTFFTSFVSENLKMFQTCKFLFSVEHKIRYFEGCW